LIGTGQGRGAVVLVKAEGRDRAVLQLFREIPQLRLDFFPIVQGLL
jgi:hypothetical protein